MPSRDVSKGNLYQQKVQIISYQTVSQILMRATVVDARERGGRLSWMWWIHVAGVRYYLKCGGLLA